MPLDEIRYHFRATVSDLGRGVSGEAHLVPLHHREEPLERFFLRVIAWALWYVPDLTIAPPTHDPGLPDLFADDPTGRKSVWIAIDPEEGETIGHAIRHNRGALIGVAFSEPAAEERFTQTLRGVKGIENAEVITVEPELLARMARDLDERRYDLAVTVVEDHVYLTAGRHAFEGRFTRKTAGKSRAP